jgi:tRNA pseudouridine55 synthase
MKIDGFINVNKSQDWTSFDVVARIRKLSGAKRVGHAGTLDPLATGVLPICIGQATRVVQFLIDAPKGYLAQINLGSATDTFDRMGKVVFCGDATRITLSNLEHALMQFKGEIEQIPPSYSALKYRGKRLYDYARSGTMVRAKPRSVIVTNIELVDHELPSITVKIDCSKGTYIRSLADDLGHVLGCGAHLTGLIRLYSGPYRLEDSVTIPEMEDAFKQGVWQPLIYPVDSPLQHLPSCVVNTTSESMIKSGRSLRMEELHYTTEYYRAYNGEGHLLALLRYNTDTDLWHPDKVFAISDPTPQPIIQKP